MPKDPRRFEADRKSFTGEALTLVVGEEERRFLVHKDVLCEHSAFFKAAVSEQWKEGQERSMTLPHDTPEVLDLYIQWVYQGEIFSRKPVDMAGKGSDELDNLIKAFVFGEKVQNGHFKDAVIDALISSSNTPDLNGKTWYATGSTIHDAYSGTPDGSPLRRLVLDMHIHHGGVKWIKTECGVDFLADLAKELLPLRRSIHEPDPTSQGVSSCSYHHHNSDEECYRRRD